MFLQVYETFWDADHNPILAWGNPPSHFKMKISIPSTTEVCPSKPGDASITYFTHNSLQSAQSLAATYNSIFCCWFLQVTISTETKSRSTPMYMSMGLVIHCMAIHQSCLHQSLLYLPNSFYTHHINYHILTILTMGPNASTADVS